tara:strand:+ start:257 stop:595 length:339 start_codon:yes stop_codon:yes gene_type:complete
MDFDAIYEAYKNEAKPVVLIDEGTGAYDADGNKVTLDQSKIDAARVKLNSEAAAILYKKQRLGEAGKGDTIYPDLGEQFDLLFKDIAAGTLNTSGNFYTAIKAVKDKYPKPS